MRVSQHPHPFCTEPAPGPQKALPPADREARRAAPASDGELIAYGLTADRNGEAQSRGETTGSWARDGASLVISEGDLTDASVFPARYANTCWSLIETDDGVKVGAQYQPTEEKIESVSSFISQTGESEELRKETYEESLGWYDGIVEDMFS